MDRNVNRNLKTVRACRSFKGQDFDVRGRGARSSVGHYAKTFTNRAQRRLDRAIVRASCNED